MWTRDGEEDHLFRNDILQTFFAALNNKGQSNSRLTSLSLKNLQNINNEELVSSQDFLGIIGRISELSLKIINQWDSAAPESSWHHREMYNFFSELPQAG